MSSMKRGECKIKLLDSEEAFRPICLEKRQIGLVKEEMQIVDHGNMEERFIIFNTKNVSRKGLAIKSREYHTAWQSDNTISS